MQVSIVIPNWNTTDLLVDCVNSIYDSELKTTYEIIVVDNCSRDNFLEFKWTHPSIRYIENDSNLGFSIAIVQGLLISKGRYVCFLNSDTKPSKYWLDYLVDYLELNPECGLVAPASTNVCCEMQAPSKNKGEIIEIKGHTIPFMCVVIPKGRFLELGLPVIKYGEDVEFCSRLRSHGYKTVIVGKAYVEHLGSQCWVKNKIGRNSAVQQSFAKRIAETWVGED